jgi:hypothetical protein
MAACTLDDLVPSFRCNRIFLEPKTGNYEEYQVKIDASVYDTVEDDGGIADYLLSDTFKNNVIVFTVFSRDNRVKDFVSFLDSYWNAENKAGISPSKQSLIFYVVMNFASTGTNNSDYIYDEMLSLHSSVFGTASAVRSQSFTRDIKNHIDILIEGFENDFLELAGFGFATYSNELIQNYGQVTFDQDGNRFYDLKIPKEELSFTNKAEVQSCYSHGVCMFDVTSLIDGVEIPIDSNTVEFFFKNIDTCHILEDGMAATSAVQDFRSVERIQEIIRPDRVTAYDQVIAEVSLISDTEMITNSGITSDLYSSYVSVIPQIPEGDNSLSSDKIRTHNRFYINIKELCRRNSNVRFIYDNLSKHNISGVLRDFEPLSTNIYRVRKDASESKYLQAPDVIISNNKITNTITQYEFSDLGFTRLTDGDYTYKVEMDFLDPMYAFSEKFLEPVKSLLARFNRAMTYIHNSPQNYNELRDELNTQAQIDLRALFPPGESLFLESMSLDILFKALTGESYTSMRASSTQPQDDDVLDISFFERRKIENSKRLIEDLLFAAGKFFAIASVNNNSANATKNQSKVLSYSRTWDVNMSPNAFSKGVIAVIPQNLVELSELDYRYRMDFEKTKHGITLNVDSKNLGFVTPSLLAGLNPFSSDNPVRKYLNMFANILESGDAIEDELTNALLGENSIGYNGSVNELKNGSGMFESFLSTLGGTVENDTLDSIDTKVSTPRISKKMYSSGIDSGENITNSINSNYGQIEIISDDDLEKVEEKREQVKQNIFLEKVKIEDVVMRMLINRDGYSILDRKSFKQGEKNSRSFDYNFNYSSNVSGKAHPILHSSSEKYFRLSENGAGTEISMPLSRFVLDNTFMVFYLATFDENMNPDWRQLTNIENARAIAVSPSNQTGGVLCKLKRFQDSKMQIGQGSTSDREILSRYFYLYLD